MAAAFDKEDLTTQQAAVTNAREGLVEALDELIDNAKSARRVAASKAKRISHERIASELATVYGASRALERAEETLDLAHLDLATASGEDA